MNNNSPISRFQEKVPESEKLQCTVKAQHMFLMWIWMTDKKVDHPGAPPPCTKNGFLPETVESKL